MSIRIDILQEGYNRWHQKPYSALANGTSTLIRSGSQTKIIVDTLGPWSRDDLLKHLTRFDLTIDDISAVIGTHNHIDHIGNHNLFPKAAHYVGDERYSGDFFEFQIFHTSNSIELATNIQLLPTPGHTLNDVTVLCGDVENLGTVAIVGDLFESKFDLANKEIWIDAGSMDIELQERNRRYILSQADYIIPGHGSMFRVVDYYNG